MRFLVTSYNSIEKAHKCKGPDGYSTPTFIDLLTHGDFPKDTKPESLVNKTISIGWLNPYISIAQEVRIIPPESEA